MSTCADVTWLIFVCIGAASTAIVLMMLSVSTSKTVVRCLLMIIFKLHKRKVYFSPFDSAIINQSIDYVDKGKWKFPRS